MAPQDDRTVVVVDSDPAWDRMVLGAHRIVRVAPERGPLPPQEASVAIVNLAAPGSLDALAAWPWQSAPPPVACVTVMGSEHAVLLRTVAVVPALRPADAVARHVRRRRRRRPRVVAAGGSPGVLLALRRVLAADGFGVSVAWDGQQAADLCDLVIPHVLVLDLGLPRGGHDLVVALGLRPGAPDLVLMPAGDDACQFAAAFVRARRSRALPRRHEALGALFARTSQRVA